mgnify:CR=1 FL=1
MIVKSRQDTYQYTHDQKQAGFSADVGFDGKPQSFSINGGKTDVDDPNTLTQAQKDKLINQAKLIAGITAAFAGEDVNVAASVAAEAVQNNALAQQDFNKLYNLYEKIQGRGKNILGQYKMTLAEAEELTNLVILDQVGNQLIDKYRQNPSLLSYSELMALGDILNYYYAGGNSLSHIQSMLTNHTGSTLKPNDYLFNRGTGDEHEKIFWDAATQRNINKQVSDVASLGGDAVFAAPGKVMNVVRIATGSTMIASGIQSVKQGKTGRGSFQVVAGTLMFVPIGKKAVSTNQLSLSGTISHVNGYATSSYNGMRLNLDLRTTEAANSLIESLRSNGRLPSHYITKIEAGKNGWQAGKALNSTNPGKQIGGDIFWDTPSVVPNAPRRIWYEADVGLKNTISRSKQPGTRLLYSNDGLLYITTDHYQSVTFIGRWK